MPDEQDPRAESAGYWEDDPDYPVADWQYEVANGDTRRGYHEWVEAKKEDAKFDG